MKTALDLLSADQARALRAAGSVALSAAGAALRPTKSFGASGPGWLFDRPDLTEGSNSAAKLTHPYAQSPWIMRAIQTKQGEIKSAPVKFYEGDVEFEDAALSAWWQAGFMGPGKQRLSADEVRNAALGWADLAGEFFLLLGDDWLVPFPSARGARLSPPVLARPDRMRHVVRGGELLGWEFTDGAGARYSLLPEQVTHRKLWNPYDDFRGLAPVEALLIAAESDYAAGVYVRNLMRNNGDQGVYVIAKNGIPTDEQRAQIIADLRAKRLAAQRGDFRPVFLTGDIAVEDAKAQAPDANLQQTRLLDRHTIFIGLGLPASMADVQASYSIGSDSDRFRLITSTCQGQAMFVDEPFGVLASKLTGRTLTAEADWDEHPVIQEVRRARIEGAIKLWGVGMPMQAVNDYLDMGLEPFAGWDQGYLPFSVVPTARAEPPTTDPALAEEPGDDDEPAEMRAIRLALAARRRLKCKRVSSDATAHRCSCAFDSSHAIAKDRDPAEVARWLKYMQARREQVKGFESRFGRWLTGLRATVLAKLDAREALTGRGVVQKSTAVDFLFTVAEATADFLAAMRKQQSLALNAAGKEVFLELGRDDPFVFAPEEVLQFVRGRENKLRGVPADVFERLRSTLQEGLDGGESIADLAKRIRSECNAIDKGRATVIAQTETSAAYGVGRDKAMRRAGIKFKAWLTSGNSNVREAHLIAGETYSPDTPIPIDQPFIVDGEALMFPGDPAGSPGNTINCHCIQIAVAAPQEATE